MCAGTYLRRIAPLRRGPPLGKAVHPARRQQKGAKALGEKTALLRAVRGFMPIVDLPVALACSHVGISDRGYRL